MVNEEFLRDLCNSDLSENLGLLLNLLRSDQIPEELKVKYSMEILNKLSTGDADDGTLSCLIEVRDLCKDYLHKNRRIKL
jgi:hypothetical protein